MPRPKGSKNRPKSKYIRLSVLNEMFKPDTLIPVDTIRLFNDVNGVMHSGENGELKEELEVIDDRTKLEFTIT